jgi:DNA helicase MCM9
MIIQREIKTQENMQVIDVGLVPRSMLVILKDDLVDFVKVGDDIIVTVLFAKVATLVQRCSM